MPGAACLTWAWLLHVDCDSERTDCQRDGHLLSLADSRRQVGEEPLCESVAEGVYDRRVDGVDEDYLALLVVQFDGDPRRLQLQLQFGARRCMGPVRIAVAQADDPEALRGVEEDDAFPLDGLGRHPDVPLLACAHIDGPAVLPGGEAGGSQHTHPGGAPLGVVRQRLLAAVLNRGQLVEELEVGLRRVWVEGDGN